jgi:glycine dehydrogenase subunit 2
MIEKTIFEHSEKNKKAYSLPEDFLQELTFDAIDEQGLLRINKPRLPEVSEVEIVRYYTKLSQLNYGVDQGFYPLGSCTMKYNPKINEAFANMTNLINLHPYQDVEDCQGLLQILFELEQYLVSIFGFAAFSLQPCAGAQGEFVGLLIMKAYHRDQGNHEKNIILVPDSAHGTNPASASQAGLITKTVKSKDGLVDLEDLENKLDDKVAGMMLTNPNTLGIYEKDIRKIAQMVHAQDGLLYWDGANANAVMGYEQAAEVGFDICHLNLHKTFSTPHGGGGPGAGPVGVVQKLVKYLPKPRVLYKNGKYSWEEHFPNSIGKVHSFYGNVQVLLKAYAYIKMLGAPGLKEVSENAILLANYMRKKLTEHFDVVPKEGLCKHEFVISLKRERQEYGVKALDVAKRLMDYGFHPPTIYFPLIVSEALMMETTETETKETIDSFVEAMIKIKKEIEQNADLVKNAPHKTSVLRLDEVRAVKEPNINFFDH